MNRIDARFAALRRAGRAGVIAYVTAGDPAPTLTVPLLHALADSGADIIELGMPFSDPVADGPTIQRAHQRALDAGVDTAAVLTMVREFRAHDAETPIVFMGYVNPVAHYGWQAFAEAAASAGVDGVLLVDCPLEEDACTEPLAAAGLQRIRLLAPTTAARRQQAICKAGEGFLYHVAVAGTTGAATVAVNAVADRVQAARRMAAVPVAVGFGIRGVEQAQAVARFADAVVMGSVLVEALADARDAATVSERTAQILAPVHAALAGTDAPSNPDKAAT